MFADPTISIYTQSRFAMNRTIKKVSLKLHLWLGLVSGIIIFIVCITGCLYAFKDEITDLTQPWRFVTSENKLQLLPSEILKLSNENEPDKQPASITYGESYDAVSVDYFDANSNSSTVYVNPYNGTIKKRISKNSSDFDFFKFIIKGHKSLWLPADIGRPIVGYGVLLFAITLITGLILWWPKNWNKKTVKRLFSVKWKASFTRVNFDLHNVLGGYSALILLVLAFTGLIRNLDWFSESVYYITSGGKSLIPYSMPQSDTLQANMSSVFPIDKLYTDLRKAEPNAKTIYLALPSQSDGVIRVSIVHERGSYYRTDNLFFDQYSLKQLDGTGPYAGKYTEVSAADKFRRMNLDIHDGRILGIWGKIIVFIASLTGASLPITGVIMWIRKRKTLPVIKAS